MKLQIGPNLENGRVRLDYKSSPEKPSNAPSYTIPKENADEFINQYNLQSKKLHKLTTACTIAGGISGWAISIKNTAEKNKRHLFATIFGIPAGLLTGALVSSIISYEKKDSLMDKYNVKIYQK